MQSPDKHFKCQGIQTHYNNKCSYGIKAENHITEYLIYKQGCLYNTKSCHAQTKRTYTSSQNDHPDYPVLHIRADRQKSED